MIECPVCGDKRGELLTMMAHLKTVHKWSRGKVTAWMTKFVENAMDKGSS